MCADGETACVWVRKCNESASECERVCEKESGCMWGLSAIVGMDCGYGMTVCDRVCV